MKTATIPRRLRKNRQRKHASRRAEERYGLALDKRRYKEAVRQIQSGKAKFLSRDRSPSRRGRFTHWLVNVDGTDMRVVYDNSLATITTVLPPRGRS